MGIKKNYRMGKVFVPALQGVSFEVTEGEFVAFFGSLGEREMNPCARTLPLTLAFYAWAIVLSVTAIHFLREFTWKKAASISITAYLIYLFVRGFLGI